MKVVLVGSSSGILDKERGELIDSHDIVVRFNEFIIKDYEQYCGTKTDIICVARNPTLLRMYRHAIYRDYIKDVDTVWYTRLKRKVLRHGKEHQVRAVSNITKFRYMSPRLFNRCQTKRNRRTRRWLSTGLMGVFVALEKFKESEINIVGFDGFSTKHYYHGHPAIPQQTKKHMRRHPSGKDHCNNTEKRILKKMINTGRIKVLQ